MRSEKLGEVATEFDRVHNIHRAVEVGSVDEVIAATELRPKIISALEKGSGARLRKRPTSLGRGRWAGSADGRLLRC